MADKKLAIEAWQEFKGRIDSRYKHDRGIRFGLTGDGRGSASQNYYYPGGENKIWVREYGREDSPFPVINRNRVRPAVNLPVVIGYDDLDPQNEQILGVNYAGLPGGSDGGVTDGTDFSLGNHHTQHEWGGGDEVFIDGRQFVPGLVRETTPPSTEVVIKPFVYYYGGSFNRYAGGSSVDLSSYKPSGSLHRYVAITFDESTGSLAYDYRESSGSSNWGLGDLFAGTATGQTAFDLIPPLQDNHIPLGAIHLTSATSAISQTDPVNLFDLRLHVGGKNSGGTEATAVGQIQISLDGQSFSAKIPLTDKHAGLLFDSQSGYIIVA